MTNGAAGAGELAIRDRLGRLGLRLDRVTGLPNALLVRGEETDEEVLPLTLTAALEINGEETHRPPRELAYINTDRLEAFQLVAPPRHRDHGPDETFVVASEADGWQVTWEYTFRRHHPRLSLSISVGPPRTAPTGLLRDLHLNVSFQPQDLEDWRVEAPGNPMRPGVAADALVAPVAISPAGGVRGSTGIVAVHQPARSQTVVVWPFSRTEIGQMRVRSDDDYLALSIDTGLAGRIAGSDTLHYGTVAFDALDRSWSAVRDEVPTWYRTMGLATPHDRPEWIGAASIFEVQIGFSVFRDDYRYAPYPTVRDLLSDLGRIKGLGYDCLQIMPRQPYPSYNVHDYNDITTSYGDEQHLRTLVEACHGLNMRVILDILLHGVIDQEVMAQTAERVRTGPYYARLAEGTTGAFDAGTPAIEAMHVAWSRHILDFERHWTEGSPFRHPLVEAHPSWFMRDSTQTIIGIYTKAFDVANLAWQDYFTQAAVELVRRLDIDGFRFDAPTYNALPNWSTATARRASYSPLGCLDLFDRLRSRLKRCKPDIVLYTEPSGVLFRQAMDITYNYDEQWLIGSVLRPAGERRNDGVTVRNGRDLAAWFRDRNAVLPVGSLIAHHIDSHDTFWWPLPGEKWRREQYGVPATRALLAIFALSGGAYMTFVGGEQGLEADIRRVHRLRSDMPAINRGIADYDAVAVDHEAIYAVVRRLGEEWALLLVNLANQPLAVRCSLDADRLGLEQTDYVIYDAWNDRTVDVEQSSIVPSALPSHLQLTFDPFQPRLLTMHVAGQLTRTR